MENDPLDEKTLERKDLYLQIMHSARETGYFDIPRKASSDLIDPVLKAKVKLLEDMLIDYKRMFGVPFHVGHFVRDRLGELVFNERYDNKNKMPKKRYRWKNV